MTDPRPDDDFVVQTPIVGGGTEAENETIVRAVIHLLRLLEDHPRVQDWWKVEIPILVRQLDETGDFEQESLQRLFSDAQKLCAEVGLPSWMVGQELYMTTLKIASAVAMNTQITSTYSVVPLNEDEVRAATEQRLTIALRHLADEVEQGVLTPIPWRKYRRTVADLASQPGAFADAVFLPDPDAPVARRPQRAAADKAEALYRTRVDGIPVRQYARELVRNDPDPNVARAAGDGLRRHVESRRSSVIAWCREMCRLLLIGERQED